MAAALIAHAMINVNRTAIRLVVATKSSSRENHVTSPYSLTERPSSVRGGDLKSAYGMPAAKARARVHLDLEPRRFP